METSSQTSSLEAWLSGLGLSDLAERFLAADIDLSVVPLLSDEDLKEVGVTSLGHRRKLLAAANSLKAAPVEPKSDDGGSRRFITVMFCDIVAATQMAEAMEGEAFSELLSKFYAKVGDVARRFGGHVAQHLGDGVLVYFGTPVPMEDAAFRAAMAAQDLHLTLADDDLNVRIGLASGLVVIDPEPTGHSHAFGATVNFASRLQSEATSGTTVMSETTATLISERFDIRALGARDLKGIEGSRQVFELGEPIINAQPNQLVDQDEGGTFVGRAAEMLALEQTLSEAEAGRKVLIWGEAGIGKSRLVGNFLAQTQSEDVSIRRILCTPLATAVPYFPLNHTLSELANLGDLEAAALVDRLTQSSEDAPVDSKNWRDETRALLHGYLTTSLARGIEILWIEDLHWADPSTMEVIRLIVEKPGAGRLVILTSRQAHDLDQAALPADTQRLHLQPMDADDTAQLVRIGLGERAQNETLVKQLSERADGIPIFAEELAKTLRELGDDDIIPASLQQSLQARIERLGAGRGLLRLASAMARVAPLKLLRLLWTGPGPIEAAAIELVDAGFARLQSGVGASGETVLEIRHQLMRECAYDMILSRDRTRIHSAIADLILGPEGQGLSPGIVAEQLERAGRAQAAAEHWAEAARLAAAQSAYAEAAALYQRALDQLAHVKDMRWAERFEADVLFKLYPVLIGQGGYIQIDAAFRARLTQVATNRGDARSAFAAVFVEWLTLYAAGEIDRAHELGVGLADLAKADGTGISQLVLDRMLGNTYLFRGELDQADLHITRFIDTFDPGIHRAPLVEFGASDNLVVMYSSLAVLRALQGDRVACVAGSDACQASARVVGQVQSHCTATGFGGAFPMLLIEDYEAAGRYVGELSSWIEGQNLAHWTAYRDMFEGIVMIANTQINEGEAKFGQGLRAITQHGDNFLVASLTTLADRARARVGQPAGGHESEIARGQDRGERWLMS